jgi:ApbE superfamily uncharacterized protein (UPF0280 family)
MRRRHFEVGETAVTIVAEDRFQEAARASVFRSRETIQRFIARDPLFRVTLEPYPCPTDVPPLIARMCASSSKAKVGPMAAVAGAIAEQAVLDMRAAGATQAIVDNGGDIALLLDREASVGLYAGELVQGLGFQCSPREGIFGICTSSATIGPSISFGISDAATVIAADVTLADACATRLGNLLTSDHDEAMRSALSDVCSIDGVEGAVAVVGGKIAMKGRLPRLTRMTVPPGKVARIELPAPSP